MTAATRILLIEDDQDDAILTADLFAEIGDTHYVLHWVDSYESGVQRLLNDPPDLCLLDFRLGARTGLELLRDVTASGCTVPIVFLTGQAERELDVEAMRAGAAGYLIKGQFGPSPLERTIRYAIERSRSAAALHRNERRQAEAERVLAAELLTSAIESIPQAFALYGSDDRLVQCNSAYQRLLGGEHPAPLIGRPYAEIFTAWAHTLVFTDAEEHARRCEAWTARRLLDGDVFEVRTGDHRTLRASARRTPSGGVVEILWDITEDVLREDELRRARQAADEANAAKSSFLASVSHELRTPLNAILGFSQLLQRDGVSLPPHQVEWISHIYNSGEHLLRLINDILDLSHVESGSFTPVLAPVQLSEVLHKVIAALGPMAANMRLAVTTRPIPAALDWVEADRTRLSQILMNFATNAVKYNVPGGRVCFEVHAAEPGRTRVSVSDSGIGIPLARQAEIFQPFRRAGQETGPVEGTGIGLALSKRLANLMRGAVGFHSASGTGSTFWVELPTLTAPTRPAPANMIDAAPTLVRADGDRHQVLYIEDNPANVLFLLALLGSFDGIDTLVAETGEAGISLACQHRPDAIIVDINLPDMTGFEVLSRLRALPETADIPVIALSAAAFAGDRKRGEQIGFFRYITKPVDIGELEATLVQLRLLTRAARNET